MAMATTVTTERQAKEMDELVSDLADTLVLHYPEKHIPEDDILMNRWLQELTHCMGDCDAANEIVRCATIEWKSRPTAASSTSSSFSSGRNAPLGPTSFSLLDQLSAFPPRVFFDEIEAASTPQQRLQLLTQVDHVDDLASDWPQVLELLLDGLQQRQHDYKQDYLQLHEKWFQQCASSQDYTFLQYSLCENILKALQQHFQQHVHVSTAATSESLQFPDNHRFLFDMMQVWVHMWTSSLTHWSTDDVSAMARDAMTLVCRRGDTTISCNESILLPIHFMSLVDPYATWMHKWIVSVVTPAQAVNLLQSTGMWMTIVQSCRQKGCQLTDATTADETPTETILIEAGCDVPMFQLERAVWIHSICMLRSVLQCTRVVLFPWKELSDDDETEKSDTIHPSTIYQSPPADEVLEAMAFFVTMLTKTSTNDETTLVTICCEAIETILWGVRDDALFRSGLQMIMEAPLTHSTVDCLFDALARVYHGRDWGNNTTTEQELIAFLKVQWQRRCELESNMNEHVKFETALQAQG